VTFLLWFKLAYTIIVVRIWSLYRIVIRVQPVRRASSKRRTPHINRLTSNPEGRALGLSPSSHSTPRRELRVLPRAHIRPRGEDLGTFHFPTFTTIRPLAVSAGRSSAAGSPGHGGNYDAMIYVLNTLFFSGDSFGYWRIPQYVNPNNQVQQSQQLWKDLKE